MKKTIKIIGVPMDLGQSKRGVDMGPSALRYAGLASRLEKLGFKIVDEGNIHVPVRESLKNQSLFAEICNACELVYTAGRTAILEKTFPLFLGGDHSLSIGSIGGVTHDEPAGVIWIDAHGDFNTINTTSSGDVHGMSLAVLIGNGQKELVDIGRPGRKVNPKDVVIIGVRDLDREERKMLKKHSINIFTMRDIDELGINEVTRKALKLLDHLPRLHISLDVDCIDPQTAPGVGTPVSGGLTSREAHLMMEIIADSDRLRSMDIVEINPILDNRNQTANIAVELAVSIFGKSIL